MNLNEMLTGGVGILVIAMTLIQITPVKLNPWSSIARVIGRALNVEVVERLDKQIADAARYRILRFDDELRHEKTRLHSREHFNQIISDIDNYEDYCHDHPKYPNEMAVMAIDNIRKTWEKCRNEHSFLE